MGKKKQLSTSPAKAKPEFRQGEDGAIQCKAEEKAFDTAFGTDNQDMSLSLLAQMIRVLPGWDAEECGHISRGALAIMEDIAPQNSVESMLAVQMVAAHNMAMNMAARAMLPDQTFEGVTENMSRANRMMKTFVSQTEALAKLRGNTKTVTIKHVNVNEGGQAIIGNVHHGGISDDKK